MCVIFYECSIYVFVLSFLILCFVLFVIFSSLSRILHFWTLLRNPKAVSRGVEKKQLWWRVFRSDTMLSSPHPSTPPPVCLVYENYVYCQRKKAEADNRASNCGKIQLRRSGELCIRNYITVATYLIFLIQGAKSCWLPDSSAKLTGSLVQRFHVHVDCLPLLPSLLQLILQERFLLGSHKSCLQ